MLTGPPPLAFIFPSCLLTSEIFFNVFLLFLSQYPFDVKKKKILLRHTLGQQNGQSMVCSQGENTRQTTGQDDENNSLTSYPFYWCGGGRGRLCIKTTQVTGKLDTLDLSPPLWHNRKRNITAVGWNTVTRFDTRPPILPAVNLDSLYRNNSEMQRVVFWRKG